MALTEEKKSQIIEAYKRGDKTVVIEQEFAIGPGTLYRVLRGASIPFRSQDPNHLPSMAWYTQAPSKKLNMTAARKLIQLSHEEVAYFKSKMDRFVQEYLPADKVITDHCLTDCHCEAWIEYVDELADRVGVWITALGDDAGGIVLGLTAYMSTLEAIKKLNPEDYGEVTKQ